MYQKRNTDEKNPVKRRFGGFTLIELLVVVLIIGILAAVALPKYELAVEKSRAAEGISLARSIALANQAYYMANGSWSDDINELDVEFPGTDEMAGGVDSKGTKNFSCRATGASAPDYIAVCRRKGPKYTYAIAYHSSDPGQALCVPGNPYGDAETNKVMCRALTNKTSEPYTFN